jgi:hypothetical protein
MIMFARTIVFAKTIVARAQDQSYLLECRYIFLLGFFINVFLLRF